MLCKEKTSESFCIDVQIKFNFQAGSETGIPFGNDKNRVHNIIII